MNKMKFYREKAGLSAGKLARKIGLSDTTVTLAELGHMKPYPKLRKAIADALRVPESDIFDERGWVRHDEISDPESN